MVQTRRKAAAARRRRRGYDNAGLAVRRDPALRRGACGQLGRFIWQLVGVLDTYGSNCLIVLKV